MTQLDSTLQMFKDLTDANGIAGNERAPREVMKKIHRTIRRFCRNRQLR